MTTFDKIINQKNVHMTFYISNVASNSLYRDIEVRFFDNDSQTFIDITEDVASELQMKVKNGGVRIDGVGMNMAFALSQSILKHTLEKYGKEIQIENHIFTRNEMDLYINFIQGFLKENRSSVWLLEQYDQWFSNASRTILGVFTSKEKALKSIGYGTENWNNDYYENGSRGDQWLSDTLECGVMVREAKLDKFEEL